MPCGRNSSTRISTISAPTYFKSDGSHSVDSSTKRPTMMEPDERAERGAESAEGDRGEDEQQDLEAHVPAHPGPEVRPQDAARARRARRPITQTMRMTRSTSMPLAAARLGLSETARVALPMRVRSRKNANARSTTIEVRHARDVDPRERHRSEVDVGRDGGARQLPGRLRRRRTGTCSASRARGRCSRS